MENRSYKHWLMVVAMCGLAGSAIGVCNNCLGVFYTVVSEELGVLRGTFAMTSTLQMMATACVSFFIAGQFKKHPFRRIFWTGVLLATLSTVGMAMAKNLYLFYFFSIIRGIGSSAFGIVPVTMMITNWFVKKHGIVTSLALSFSGIAGAALSPILTGVIESSGWRTAYLVQAVWILGMALPGLVLPYTMTPEESGLLPYGAEPQPEAMKAETGAKKESTFRFVQVSFLVFCVFTLFHNLMTSTAQHFNGFALEIGMAATVGAAMTSMGMIGNIGSKLIIGVLSDMFGSVKACVIMIVANMIAFLMIILGGRMLNVPFMMAGALIYGSIYAVGAVGGPLLTRTFFGAENYTKAYGPIAFLGNSGNALGLSLIGYLYDFTGTYYYAFFIAIGLHVIDLVLLRFVYVRTIGQKRA